MRGVGYFQALVELVELLDQSLRCLNRSCVLRGALVFQSGALGLARAGEQGLNLVPPAVLVLPLLVDYLLDFVVVLESAVLFGAPEHASILLHDGLLAQVVLQQGQNHALGGQVLGGLPNDQLEGDVFDQVPLDGQVVAKVDFPQELADKALIVAGLHRPRDVERVLVAQLHVQVLRCVGVKAEPHDVMERGVEVETVQQVLMLRLEPHGPELIEEKVIVTAAGLGVEAEDRLHDYNSGRLQACGIIGIGEIIISAIIHLLLLLALFLMISSQRLQMMLTVRRMPVPEPMAPSRSANTVSRPMQMPPRVAAVRMSCLSFWQVLSLVQPLMNMPSFLRLPATSLGPWPDTQIQVLLKRAQLPTMKRMQRTVWMGSRRASRRERGEVRQQMKPPTGTSWPWLPASCQLPRMLVMKEPLKLRYNICEKKQRLETRAVCRMMGMLEVQNSRIEQGVSVDVLLLLSFRLTWKPWKKITIRNTRAVESRLVMLVRSLRKRAFWMEPSRLLRKMAPQSSSMMEPSYCSWTASPPPTLQEMGEKQLQSTVSAMLMAINRLVPELPMPQPLVMMSSSSMVITEAKVSCTMMRMALPAPISSMDPYMPDQVQAKA